MQQPLVSIIIPTYNRAHLISETLDSIVAQTYENWECIIVDDGSSDHTDEVITRYSKKDSRFQYYRRPEYKPKGANACRNYGFEMSKGNYICWFDSDDVMLNQRLQVLLNSALTNNADVIISNRVEEEIIEYSEFVKEEKSFIKQGFDHEYILNKFSILTGDIIFKRNIVESYRFDEKLHKAQEFEFFIRVFSGNLKYSLVNHKLWTHRNSPDSISKKMTQNKSKQVNSIIYLSKSIQARYSNNTNIVNEAKRFGRKQYKSLIQKRKIKLLLKNFMFFKRCHDRNFFIFSLFFIYNFLTRKGFDAIKK